MSVSDTELVFDGDVRAAFVGYRTLISAPLSGLAEDGLLVSIDSVAFDATNSTTVVGVSDASLADAFAQFNLDTQNAGVEGDAGLRAPGEVGAAAAANE